MIRAHNSSICLLIISPLFSFGLLVTDDVGNGVSAIVGAFVQALVGEVVGEGVILVGADEGLAEGESKL